MKAYLHKPTSIEAVQWSGTNFLEIEELMGKGKSQLDFYVYVSATKIGSQVEGTYKLKVGEWLARVGGRWWLYSDEQFRHMYIVESDHAKT